MKFVNDYDGKVYATQKECLEAEAATKRQMDAEREKKELAAEARKADAEKVEKAIQDVKEARNMLREAEKELSSVLTDFCKKHGAYHTSFKDAEPFSLFSDLFNLF